MSETPSAIYNVFGLTRTASVTERCGHDAWAQAIAKYRVEHERERARLLTLGGELGPVTYSEWRDDFTDVRGEWRSEILRLPDVAA